MRYKQISPSEIEELTNLIGKRNLFTESIDIEGYSYDESPLTERFMPQVVVKPRDTATVAKVMAFAHKKQIPITPRGAGTGVSGGSMPIYGGIVLSLEKMKRIVEIDTNNSVAVVEPGVTLAQLREELDKHNLCYPLYPGELNATIGGNVATNAGGMNAVKYGVTRHHIMGIEAVLPKGDIINSGGKFVKSSTAYDLTQLIIGSEGTLAIVTKIILKLSSKKTNREVLLVPFSNLQNAIDAVPDILRLPLIPNGLEFMEKNIIDIVEQYTNWELPYHEYQAFLMVIMEGETPEVVIDYFNQVNTICQKHGSVEGVMPSGEGAKRRLLQTREKFYPAIKAYSQMDIIDTVVPRSAIAQFMSQVREISHQYGIPIIGYGHAGDGNVHLHILHQNMGEEEWRSRLPELTKTIYITAVSLGGAISGEHGIGFIKKDYLPLQMNEAQLNLLKSIKNAFDPNHILNPGKIFDL